MSRILRIALLGLALAIPFAIPQASQAAAPVCVYPNRPVYTRYYRPYSYGWYRYHWYGHHRHGHYRHHR
jgi:hypothetical protein